MYGGEDNILAAYGQQFNGITTIMFRRKIQSTDPQSMTHVFIVNFLTSATDPSKADHSLSNAEMHVIWAHGMVFPNYTFPKPSGRPIHYLEESIM